VEFPKDYIVSLTAASAPLLFLFNGFIGPEGRGWFLVASASVIVREVMPSHALSHEGKSLEHMVSDEFWEYIGQYMMIDMKGLF
jgi:hypothetical protein